MIFVDMKKTSRWMGMVSLTPFIALTIGEEREAMIEIQS